VSDDPFPPSLFEKGSVSQNNLHIGLVNKNLANLRTVLSENVDHLSLVRAHDIIVAREEGGNKMYRFLAIIESGEGLVN